MSSWDTDFGDTLFSDGDQTELTIGTTAQEATVSASSKEGRQLLVLQPQDNGIYYGFTSSVTTGTGIQMFRRQTVTIPVGDSTSVYLIASGNNRQIRVAEVG